MTIILKNIQGQQIQKNIYIFRQPCNKIDVGNILHECAYIVLYGQILIFQMNPDSGATSNNNSNDISQMQQFMELLVFALLSIGI